MLRHRLHCKIERAETDMYLTGALLLLHHMLCFCAVPMLYFVMLCCAMSH